VANPDTLWKTTRYLVYPNKLLRTKSHQPMAIHTAGGTSRVLGTLATSTLEAMNDGMQRDPNSAMREDSQVNLESSAVEPRRG